MTNPSPFPLPSAPPHDFEMPERITVTLLPDGMLAMRVDWTLSGDQHDAPRNATVVLRPSAADALAYALGHVAMDSDPADARAMPLKRCEILTTVPVEETLDDVEANGDPHE